MTQTELAERIGIDRASLNQLLNGKRRVGVQTAKKLAAYLKEPARWRAYVLISPEGLKSRLLLHCCNNPNNQQPTCQD